MPPKERDALSDEEVQAFYHWIVAGAPWPNEAEQKRIAAAGGPRSNTRIKVQTSGGQNTHWEQRYYRLDDLWSYRRPAESDMPSRYPDKHPVDAFIDHKLNHLQLPAADLASKLQLVKRVYYDLLGLPPTKQQLDAFLHDHHEDAFERLIDQLLDSPQYGEQWARHWLDVVRYSDSDGFSNDYLRPNAWRYRGLCDQKF